MIISRTLKVTGNHVMYDRGPSFLRVITSILVRRAHDPSDLRHRLRALAGPDFLSMRRVFVSYSQPIRFARFDGKSVLDQTKALDPCRRSEGSWVLGTRMNQVKFARFVFLPSVKKQFQFFFSFFVSVQCIYNTTRRSSDLKKRF